MDEIGMTPLKQVIVETIQQVADEQGLSICATLSESTVLLESGLDSLAFAILVSELESRLGYDPFVLMDTPQYPRTLAEFLGVYQKYEDHRTS